MKCATDLSAGLGDAQGCIYALCKQKADEAQDGDSGRRRKALLSRCFGCRVICMHPWGLFHHRAAVAVRTLQSPVWSPTGASYVSTLSFLIICCVCLSSLLAFSFSDLEDSKSLHKTPSTSLRERYILTPHRSCWILSSWRCVVNEELDQFRR